MLDELIKNNSLEDFSEKIHSIVVPCVVGETLNEKVSMGDSKVGGLPHVTKDFSWPFFDNYPLEFIAQINCEDVQYKNYPESGLLLFFYDNRHWGLHEKEKGFIKIEYLNKSMDLIVSETPIIEKKILWGLLGSTNYPRVYKETRLIFRPDISIPDIERGLISFENEGIEEAYRDLKCEFVEKRFVQIGGFPNPEQNDNMEANIVKIMEKGKTEEWIMILEVGCDKNTDMMWGDAGRIHFFTHIDDLKEKNFSSSWLELQCG